MKIVGSYTVALQRKGFETGTKQGDIEMSDKFKQVLGDEKAGVKVAAGMSHDYGSLRCTAEVFLKCGQTEEEINKAGELAFYKAKELMEDGMSVLMDAVREAGK